MNAVYTYPCVDLTNSVGNLRNWKKLRVFEIGNCAVIFSFAGRRKIWICWLSRYEAKLVIKCIGYFNITILPSMILAALCRLFAWFLIVFQNWSIFFERIDSTNSLFLISFSLHLQYFRALTKSFLTFLVYPIVSCSTPHLTMIEPYWECITGCFLSLQKSFQPGTGRNTLAFVIVNSLVASWNACTSIYVTDTINASSMVNITLRGISYLQVLFFFLLLNLEAWNLACVCNIEIP